MLEEILLFRSTYTEQLLLDATLIGSTEPIQPCRDGESQLCSLQDTHHWQSNPSEYRQYPPHQPIQGSCFGLRSVLLLGQWEEVSGRFLRRNGFTPVKMTPKFPRKMRWRAEVSRDSLCHHELCAPGGDGTTKGEGGGGATGEEGTPWHRCSCQKCQLGQVLVLPPRPSCCRWLRGNLEPGKTEDRSGMCCGAPATYPRSPPSSGQGRSSCAPASTLYTKHTKGAMSQQPLLTRWDKASPGGRRSHLTSFKGEKCSHTTAGGGLKSAQTARSTPPSPTHTASPQTQRPSSLR